MTANSSTEERLPDIFSPQRFFLDAPKQPPGTCFVLNTDFQKAMAEVARLRAGLLTIATGGAKWPVGHAAMVLYGEEPTPPDVACEHEWVSARNEAVTSGEMCRKCYAIRAEDSRGEKP